MSLIVLHPMQKKLLPHIACSWVLKTLERQHKWLSYDSYFPKIIPYASLMTVICYRIISTMICTEPLMHFVTKSNHCLALKSWKDCRGKTNRKKRAPCVHKQKHSEGVGIGGQTLPWAGTAGSSCAEGHSAGARGRCALMVTAATAPQGCTWE